jgi:murein DD-endopeptidase MepM/ murein hydrolase activator NlpD
MAQPPDNLFAIKKYGTGTGSTEVHILDGASNYQRWLLHTGTPLQATDSQFAFAVGYYTGTCTPDLYVIQKNGTGTGSTEVHVLSGASNYQNWALHYGTPLKPTYDNFDFQVTPFNLYQWPVRGPITQYFSQQHPAIDIGVPPDTPVTAARPGVVREAGWGGCYGNYVLIDHGDGDYTRYAHLNSIYVGPGTRVDYTTVVGASGNTGCTTGPHLHFEIAYRGTLIDPLTYLPQ